MNLSRNIRPEEILGFEDGSAVGDHHDMIVRLKVVGDIVHPAAPCRKNRRMLFALIVKIDRDPRIKDGVFAVRVHRDMSRMEYSCHPSGIREDDLGVPAFFNETATS